MFRIGTTSYILPADILPNVEYLAPLVDDVELVLFETDEYGGNLPDEATCRRLAELGVAHGLSFTVHLPLDLRLGSPGAELDRSLRKARSAIDATRALDPFAYVVHLDGRDLPPEGDGAGPAALAAWQARARSALEIVAGWLVEPARLAVENLEAWDPATFAPVVAALPRSVSRTIDVGHLWLAGVDPMPHLAAWIDRARVIHLHGVAGRDHSSLAHVPPAQLDPVIAFLLANFHGVVTLEVFNEADLASSRQALQAAIQRCRAAPQANSRSGNLLREAPCGDAGPCGELAGGAAKGEG